jgi:hypothetical protein
VLEVFKVANLALRFLLELCALGALIYWGFKAGGAAIVEIGPGQPGPYTDRHPDILGSTA